MSSRSSRYSRRNPNFSTLPVKIHPNFSTLPVEILRRIALFLPKEGKQPTSGKITSNYYNNSRIACATNNPPGKRGLRYQLVNSPAHPLTERTKKMFANAKKKQGKNVARIHKNKAADEFLFGLYTEYHSPFHITSNVKGGSPIYSSPQSTSPQSIVHPLIHPLKVGGHMYLNASFEAGPNRTNKGGTRDNFMRTSKKVRAAVRPGRKSRRSTL